MRDIDPVQPTGNTPDSYKDRQGIDHIRGCGTEKRKTLQSPWLSIAGHWWSRAIVSFRSAREPWKLANIGTRGRVDSEYGVYCTEYAVRI